METIAKKDLFSEVTGKIIASLEQGVVPWHQPWGFIEPVQNHFSGHQYRGINALLFLMGDYQTPYFATIKQINEAGGLVKKGSKSTSVYFRDYIYRDAKTGAKLKEEDAKAKLKADKKSVNVYGFLRVHSVFNMSDVEGCPVKPSTRKGNEDNQAIAVCEDFFHGLTPQPQLFCKNPADRAYYNKVADSIIMPMREQFESSESYYGVLFHELTHWTGHPDRLNRKTLTDAVKFGDTNYSKEELTAEIGSAFLCNRFGIDTPKLLDQSASYIANWLTKLKSDKLFIWEAATDAQAAFSYLIDLSN